MNQGSDRVVIDWNNFDIGKNATTQFHQPGSGSIAVNKVTGSFSPTKILGTLKSNGKIVILDQNGVFFGANSRVDVGGIVASTGTIDEGAFMGGAEILQLSDMSDTAGHAAFVGHDVRDQQYGQGRPERHFADSSGLIRTFAAGF